MASYAEGLNILKHAEAGLEREASAEITPLCDPTHSQHELDVLTVTEVWRVGSVVASWLLDRAPGRSCVAATSRTSRAASPTPARGHWTSMAAISIGAPAPDVTTALDGCFTRGGEAGVADRVLSAMWFVLGGHEEGKG